MSAFASAASYGVQADDAAGEGSRRSKDPDDEYEDFDEEYYEHRNWLAETLEGPQDLVSFCMQWMIIGEEELRKEQELLEWKKWQGKSRETREKEMKEEAEKQVARKLKDANDSISKNSMTPWKASRPASKKKMVAEFMEKNGILDAEDPLVVCKNWIIQCCELNPENNFGNIQKKKKYVPGRFPVEKVFSEVGLGKKKVRKGAKAPSEASSCDSGKSVKNGRGHRPPAKEVNRTLRIKKTQIPTRFMNLLLRGHQRLDRIKIPFEVLVRNAAYDRGLRYKAHCKLMAKNASENQPIQAK